MSLNEGIALTPGISRRDFIFITPDEIGRREPNLSYGLPTPKELNVRHLLNPFGVPELERLRYPPVSLEVMNIQSLRDFAMELAISLN